MFSRSRGGSQNRPKGPFFLLFLMQHAPWGPPVCFRHTLRRDRCTRIGLDWSGRLRLSSSRRGPPCTVENQLYKGVRRQAQEPCGRPLAGGPREGPLTSGIIHISCILSPSRAPPISGSPHATGTTLYQTRVARRTNIRAIAQEVLGLGLQAIPRRCIAHRGNTIGLGGG